ncbi:TerD family protein [Xanthomonas arboricola]|uniref:TerD family protein n=1 Tax=Xanthomonas arboricola TaxID=56448 RepID=UPI000E1F3E29|nr:TerD family protein [Xanthomonas arboricola]
MTQVLRAGENTQLPATVGEIVISHQGAANLDINLTAFLVDESGKISKDSDMVFFNADRHPSGAAIYQSPVQSGSSIQHRLLFDLALLPPGIARIAVTLSEDGSIAGFASVEQLVAKVTVNGNVFELMPATFATEKGIIVLEMYLRNGQAKVRSVWQGFASGLKGLCDHYGVSVSDEPATPAPAPAPVSVAKVTLSKSDESHRISLAKGPSRPEKIVVKATWIDNGDGLDNDDLDLRVGILYPDGRMGIIQAPDKAGSLLSAPYVFHTGDVVSASVSAPGTEKVEVNPDISKKLGGKVGLVFSVYSAISNGAVSVASLKPQMRIEYGQHVVECAYAFEHDEDYGIYTYVIGLIDIDGDTINIRPAGVTSADGSEETPWLSRKLDCLVLSMDGPPVFKGQPPSKWGKKRYV